MRHQDDPRRLNGHNSPSWDPFGILLDIQRSIGGLEVGQELTREQMTSRLDRLDERIDIVHERIDTHLAKPKAAEKRGWMSYTGLEMKEFISLVLMALAGLGMLSPDLLKAWLGH
jgi:hypothetical protein